nr:dehydrodolichyl diphosphate synthase 2-like [Quercus suber]
MREMERVNESDLDSWVRENIRIFVIGDSSKLSRSLQELITRTEEITKATCGLQLIVAVSYSGQYDIVQACQKIALKVKDGLIEPDEINESLIKQELETNCTEFPYPDQLIRTSWEPRISNFLLWQLAYTELFFAQSLWPDFGEVEFLEALKAFQERQRRYGGRDF